MRIQCFSCFLLAVLVAGCSKSGPELAPVHGRITVDGQPMENVDITFQPDGSKPPSYGRTDKDGQYELGYKRGVTGALIGQHTVRITVSSELVHNPPKIAAKFNTNSELRREVKPGDNAFNFDATTEGK